MRRSARADSRQAADRVVAVPATAPIPGIRGPGTKVLRPVNRDHVAPTPGSAAASAIDTGCTDGLRTLRAATTLRIGRIAMRRASASAARARTPGGASSGHSRLRNSRCRDRRRIVVRTRPARRGACGAASRADDGVAATMRRWPPTVSTLRTFLASGAATLAFAANSLLCRLALAQPRIDPASIATVLATRARGSGPAGR